MAKWVWVVIIRRAMFLVAAFTMCLYAQGAATPAASFSKRLDLLDRRGSAKRKLSIAEILQTDHHRVSFIRAKLCPYADGAAPSDEPMQQSSSQAPLYSGAIVGSLNYIIKLGLGTPPKDLYLVIDTGSDLAWTQCQPCNVCYMQGDPIFEPSASTSYQQVPCASPQCAQLLGPHFLGDCSSTNAPNCKYHIEYGDGSSTMGDFAFETLTLGGNIASTAYPFGCGHQNQGLFEGFDGIVGLSRGLLAFPAQTKASFGEVFSYCMPPTFSSSAGYIEFGASSGGGDGSTSLVGLSESTFYVVELESIQVEGTSKPPSTSKKMVVDSGTVITRLDRPLYEQVRAAFKEATSSIKEAPEGAGQGLFDTCYIADSASLFPSITFAFMGGLAFTPVAQNSVVPIDNNGTVCLALLPFDSSSGFSILGNYQQQGRLFTFDIPKATLSISSEAC